jgi:GAF domain-containing protein
MAEANTAGQILDLIAVFDRPELFHLSPEALLKQVLPTIADYLPDQQAVRVYRVSDADSNVLSLWHSVGKAPSTETIDLNQTPAFAVAIRQPKAVVDDKHWLIPLYNEAEKLGVLEIRRKSASPPAVPDWIQVVGRQLSVVLAQAIQHDLAQRQAQVTTRFIETSRQLALTNSYGQIAETALLALPESIDLVGLSLFDRPILADEKPHTITTTTVALRDRTLEPYIQDSIEAETEDLRSLLGKLEDGEALSIPNIGNNDAIIVKRALAYMHQDLGIQSVNMVGLRSASRLLGVFIFGAKSVLPTNAAADYFRTLADQIAVVVQNQLLTQSTQTMTQQLQHIIDFNQSVESTFDLPSIFQVMLTECAQMFPVDLITIALYNTDQKQLVTVAQRVNDRDQVDLDSERVVSETNTTSGQIWEQRKLLYIPDLAKETALYHPLRDDLRALLGAPIHLRGTALGIVEIGSFTPYAYNDTDVTMFQQMISQLVATIENAEAYAQSQSLVRNKALASEIAAELQQQVDLDSMLNVTINQLGQTLGARRGRIRLNTDFDANN